MSWPHHIRAPNIGFDYDRVRELHGQLQRLIGDRLVLATGCDFHLNIENLEALRRDARRFCLNQRNYLLVEFSDYAIPPNTAHTLHDMQLMGLHPIITHPERNQIIEAYAGNAGVMDSAWMLWAGDRGVGDGDVWAEG